MHACEKHGSRLAQKTYIWFGLAYYMQVAPPPLIFTWLYVVHKHVAPPKPPLEYPGQREMPSMGGWGQGVIVLFFIDKRRHDFYAMLTHHVVTVSIILCAYFSGCA